MNERLAKLAEQVGFDVDNTGRFGNYSEMARVEKCSGRGFDSHQVHHKEV